MRHATTLAVVGILTIPHFAFAESPDDAKARILVAQLAADDYRTREQANRELTLLGERVLPTLRDALPRTTDPEASRRLSLIVRKLETERLTTARRVTLKLSKVTAKAALEELSKQSGYAIHTDGLSGDEAKTLYSFDLADVPFWKALDEICNAAGLTPNLQDDNGRVHVYFSDTFNPYVVYSGPFRVIASNLTVSQGLQLGGLQRARPFARQPEYMNFSFQVMGEPKAPLIGIGQAEAVAVTDDTGASMIPPLEPGQVRTFYPPQMSYRTYTMGSGLNLTRTVRNATEIKELRGTIPIMVLAETRPDVTVTNLATAKGKRFAGREIDVEITQFADQNGSVTMGVLLTRRDGNPDDYAWLNGVTQRLELYDDLGAKLQLSSIDQNTTGPNASAMTLQYAPQNGNKKLGKPSKLVLVEWMTVMKNVEFQFKRLPLP